MKVLLFGASGFLGGHVRRLLAGDPNVTSVDCPGRDRHDLVNGDVEGLTALVRDAAPDAVVNCTGRLSGTGYDLTRANTMVTAKLIEAVATAAPGARLVRLGSASEYGVVPHGVAVTENDRCEPVTRWARACIRTTCSGARPRSSGRRWPTATSR
jgi:nucleoside-diphosphate-sugar epimerase